MSRRIGSCLVYEIDVDGHLGEAARAVVGGLRVECRGRHTVLRGPLPDEAALHAVLMQIQEAGLVVLQFRRHNPEYVSKPDPE